MAFRWGIVGFGWVARDHMLPGLRAAGHEVAAVFDSGAQAQADAAALGLPVAESLEAVIAARPDAVYIATPNHAHRAPVEALAAAGLPILCEKPLAATLDDSEAIGAAARVGGALFGAAFDQRHHPAHRAIAAVIAEGAIGRATAVRIVYGCWVGPDWSETNWRTDSDAAGGGATIDLALHGLDLAQMLLGEELVALSMMLQRRVHDYAVDDGGVLSGRFESGALLQSHVSYNTPEAAPRRRLEVQGELGLIVSSDTMGQTEGGSAVRIYGRTGETAPIGFEAARTPFAAQADAFARAVRGEPHDFDIERDLRLMRRFDAAHREAQSCL